MWQKHIRFSKKKKKTSVLNLHNFSIFFILVYAVEEGELNSKQPLYQHNMLNCDAKERFQNHT